MRIKSLNLLPPPPLYKQNIKNGKRIGDDILTIGASKEQSYLETIAQLRRTQHAKKQCKLV